ncbi:MAG: glycosyltransferase, partial [Pseudonocardiaceae bacterium]
MPPHESYGQELAVVTVTYSPGETLETFLDSVVKATSRTLRVLLVDNGSTDGAPERAIRRDGVQLLRIGENVGYGSAANRGVVEWGPEVGWVVVANPDIEWHPGSLDELLEAAQRWPRAGALGPLIRRPDATVYP